MSTARTAESSVRKPLRLWPGVVAAVLLVLVRLALPVVYPDASMFAVIGAVVIALVIVVWWVFFSRAPWAERLGAIVLMIVALAATRRVVHESIRGAHMGFMLPIYGIPLLAIALVASAAVSRHLSSRARRGSIAAAILLACVAMTLVRTGGITGEGDADLQWRWTMTPEERLLAQAGDEPLAPARGMPTESAPDVAETPPSAPAVAGAPETGVSAAPAEEPPAPASTATAAKPEPAAAVAPTIAGAWPGFRGPHRDGVVRGVQIETDWSTSPPVELWRRPIGPGWSSFAILGDFAYTQEQRGEDEVVSCYRLRNGEPVWMHRDHVRFYESNGGAGPRGTPTVHNGRVYTLGATGMLNVLDAGSGALVWSRNAVADTGKTIPDWGIASSPLVIDDVVIVAVAGRLVAYEVRTGEQRWLGQSGGGGYSSPHPATIDGVPQVLLIRGARTIGVAPADGTLLWEHTWQLAAGIVQPALTGDGDVVIAIADSMGGIGTRRLAIERRPTGWTVEERWTTRGLKPYFNDFVVHEGYAYGFDGSILASIDVETGERKWKGGRYGSGQMVLLPDQDLLLVVSEEGELALVSATPDKFTEVARFKAIEGKTWNHPVLVGDVLLVRNGEEMAAFRLSRASR